MPSANANNSAPVTDRVTRLLLYDEKWRILHRPVAWQVGTMKPSCERSTGVFVKSESVNV